MSLAENKTDLKAISKSFAGLPMPANKDVTLGLVERPLVRKSAEPRFPFPIPNGWFIVARADELGPNELMPINYFGRELVLFRTADGTARLVDAYCAHLGAHFAVGGKVDGDCVRCPFHGWAYNGESGKCVEIPYSESTKVPSQAKVRSYPTLERNHMVWAWHHLEGQPPFYDVPEIHEFHDPEWNEPDCREFFIRTCCQEMAENNHDFAHFKFVHGSPDIPWDSVLIDGYLKRASAFGGSLVRETYGLGLGVVQSPGTFLFLSSTTPIDTENVHVRWTFTTPKANGPEATASIADSFLSGVSQDIPIWENKQYRPRPILTKDEKGILDHREWSLQFYSDPAGAID